MINCACVRHCTWSYTIKWFLGTRWPIFGTNLPTLWSTTKELEFKVFVPNCLYWLLWCRLPTTHSFICLLCMAVDATPSQQHWYCPLPASCPHTCTATGPLYSVITLNLSNLRCNYQKSPLLHKQFSHLSFLYHRNFNVVQIPTMTVHVSLISLCWCHCWHCTLPTVTLNHYTMLLRTVANGI